MRKKRIFPIVLGIVVFLMAVSLGVAFLRGGQQEPAAATTIASASIPTITMSCAGEQLNCLQGYTVQMDAAKLNMLLTPVDESGMLSFSVSASEKTVTSAECSVYQSAGTQALQNWHTDTSDSEADTQSVTIDLSKALTSEEEYLLEIRLLTDAGETIYYYTRIVSRSSDAVLDVTEAIQFAEAFCIGTFDVDAKDTIAAYLETDSTRAGSSFQSVDLYSAIDLVTWGTMETALCADPVVSLLEIDDTGAVMSIAYQMSVCEDEETASHYLVQDYYRIYQSDTRISLIEYARTTTQTFIGTEQAVLEDALLLGIVPEDVAYMYSSDGDTVVWVQAGELWEYQAETGALYKIFTLQDTNWGDKRAYMQDYDITILSVSSNGNVDFVVSGYSNRGPYEGTSGMQLYRYTQRSNTYEALYAVTDERDPDLVREDISTLVYLSGTDFYYYLDNTIWRYDLDKDELEVIADDVAVWCLGTSTDRRFAAWTGVYDTADALVWMDLDTGESVTIAAEEGEYIRLIGFVNDDLVYGRAKQTDTLCSETGTVQYLMHTIVIYGSDGEIIKEYADASTPVVDGYTTDNLIYLERVTAESDGSYTEAEPHQIVSADDAETESAVEVYTSAEKEEEIQLLVGASTSSTVYPYTAKESTHVEAVSVKDAKNGASEEDDAKTSVDASEVYYVYGTGGFLKSCRLAEEAFVTAQDEGCFVKNASFETLYTRSAVGSGYTVESASFDSAILSSADGIAAAWQAAEREKTVLDITGVSLFTAKMLVRQGAAVLVKTGDGQFALLTGYTAQTVTLTDAQTGEASTMTFADAEALYEQYGSVCVVCMD